MTEGLRHVVKRLLLEQMQNKVLIPAPPAEEERLKELPEIADQYFNRENPDEMQGMLDEKMSKLFDLVITTAGYPSQKRFIKSSKTKIDPIILYHKEHFNALRPNELASKYGVEFKFDNLKTAKTRSYPSGHTTQSYYLAHKLSELHPELKDALYELARQVSTSRVDRGVHFPSDLTGGILLANEIIKLEKESLASVTEAKKKMPSKKSEGLVRKYIRELIRETYFPLSGGDKMRIHHSRSDTRVDAKPQVSGFSQKIGNKPEGLWYECQDGSSETWKEFCEFGMTDGYSKYDSTYNVVLNDYEILFIPDEHHFEKFYKMYSVDHPAGPKFDKVIDWPKVAEHYAGIEICPYLYSKRDDDDSFWYYGWDVASGCIWDPSGVKELVKAGDCE